MAADPHENFSEQEDPAPRPSIGWVIGGGLLGISSAAGVEAVNPTRSAMESPPQLAGRIIGATVVYLGARFLYASYQERLREQTGQVFTQVHAGQQG
jgi:hypothetical protein